MNLYESNFDFIDCYMTRQCMINGCWAMDQSGLWEWLKNYEVNPSNGFMFALDPELITIGNIMESTGAPIRVSHSGASFGLTMRNLHYIAKNSFEEYKMLYLKNNPQNVEEQVGGANE